MNHHLQKLFDRYPSLTVAAEEIHAAYEMLEACCAAGNCVYLCGNGGSASDCEHIAGELMKSFRMPRPLDDVEQKKLSEQGEIGADLARNLQKGLHAVSLASATALNSAIINDMGQRFMFAQQIFSYGRPGDVLLCISTWGNSENVLYAAAAARAIGVRVLSLTGRDGGRLKGFSDVCIICPAGATEEIQEYHLPIYHALCAALESHFWGPEL